MTHIFKSAIITSAVGIAMTSSGFASEFSPEKKTEDETPSAPTISVEDFEKSQASLGLTPYMDTSVETDRAMEYDVEIFQASTEIEIAPEYELTNQSTAFIGSTRMSDEGFVDYQRSAITPEGRVTEPLETLASVGIRSKF